MQCLLRGWSLINIFRNGYSFLFTRSLDWYRLDVFVLIVVLFEHELQFCEFSVAFAAMISTEDAKDLIPSIPWTEQDATL